MKFSLFLSTLVFGATALAAPYKVGKLSTGLAVVSLEESKVPLATIVLTCKAGGFTETPATNGLTHLWEHMFFKGNKRIPNQEQFNRRIRQLGIKYNGDTSAEKVRYYFTLPSAFLDEGLQFMADAISTPLLDQKELEKERRVVMDEYDRSAAQPSFDARNLKRIMIYGDQHHLRDPLGHRYLIEKATREQLFKIKDEVFVPSNCAMIAGGDVKHNELMKLMNKHFSGWKNPKGWKPIKPKPFPKFPKTTEYVMTRPNIRNASFSLTFEGPKVLERPEDTYAADVLITLLGHRSGKFYKKFIDSGKTFGAGLSYYTQAQAGQVVIYGQTKPEDAAKVKKELQAEIKEWLKPDYFTKEQLEDVRRSLSINHKRDVAKPSDYTKTLAFWWPVTGLDYYGSYLDNMRKVEFKDIQAFVKRWLIDKPYIGETMMSPEDAKRVGVKDTSDPLVKKYLVEYNRKKSA